LIVSIFDRNRLTPIATNTNTCHIFQPKNQISMKAGLPDSTSKAPQRPKQDHQMQPQAPMAKRQQIHLSNREQALQPTPVLASETAKTARHYKARFHSRLSSLK
jgi:hypothetical protein